MPWGSEEEEPVVRRSESRTITVSLSSGNYRFDIVTPLDTKGVERSRFAVGEMVRLRVKVTNKGDVKSDLRTKVTDTDTSEVLLDTTTGGVDPDKSIDQNLEIGKMPNRDWHWLVAVTP